MPEGGVGKLALPDGRDRHLRQRQLTQIVVTKRGTQWVANERRGNYSLLAADDELRRDPAAQQTSRHSLRRQPGLEWQAVRYSTEHRR
jgi:hypothetical protein